MEQAIRKSKANYYKKLSPEEKADIKSNREHDKYMREREKEQKAFKKQQKILNKRELLILEFMLKSGVLYYHHGKSTPMEAEIKKQISKIKEGFDWKEYNPYIWNYQGQGNNYMSRCLLGNLYTSGKTNFATIYDVPLDGTYKFVITDSGQRGSGSFDYIKPVLVSETVEVPYVNPGAFPPINY